MNITTNCGYCGKKLLESEILFCADKIFFGHWCFDHFEKEYNFAAKIKQLTDKHKGFTNIPKLSIDKLYRKYLPGIK